MGKQPKEKINIPICVACVLLCLTLFSFHLCGGLYARYTSTATGSDYARVARFDVSEAGACLSTDYLVETVVPGTTTQRITVTNNSEVAVAYKVTVENTTQNIPFAFSVNGSEPVQDLCSVVCYLEPNSTSDIAVSSVWSEDGALEYMGMVDLIKLSIRAVQVD